VEAPDRADLIILDGLDRAADRFHAQDDVMTALD